MTTETKSFRDRTDAARQLADVLRGRSFVKPIILGIPRGGVVTGAVLAQELVADLDAVLARKLRAPFQPELAIGSISEEGHVYLTNFAREVSGVTDDYLAEERQHQMAEIERRKKLFRNVRPAVPLGGRSVIVTDDGIATGATMIAALQTARAQNPKELIVAAPVGSPERLDDVRKWCDETVCLIIDPSLDSISQYYQDFTQVEDEEVVELLRLFASVSAKKKKPRSGAKQNET